jgi:hypothetical protein
MESRMAETGITQCPWLDQRTKSNQQCFYVWMSAWVLNVAFQIQDVPIQPTVQSLPYRGYLGIHVRSSIMKPPPVNLDSTRRELPNDFWRTLEAPEHRLAQTIKDFEIDPLNPAFSELSEIITAEF